MATTETTTTLLFISEIGFQEKKNEEKRLTLQKLMEKNRFLWQKQLILPIGCQANRYKCQQSNRMWVNFKDNTEVDTMYHK